MTMFKFLAAAAAVGGVAAPLAAQSPYPYPYQQTPQPYPGQPGYGYQQGYSDNSIGAIINQLLGGNANRYNVNDRTAISQCANAAMVRAQSQYRGYNGNQGYGYQQGNGYSQGYAAPAMRVTAITSVERRNRGLRVRGQMSSGYGGQYGGQYGYQDQRYAQGYATSDLSFRCNVDYRGYVSDVRINRNDGYRG
jgi:hypothetical protein